jgi:hypothetical protein
MTNDQMIANRFARWHRARRMIGFIKNNLSAGHEVHVVTNLRRTVYKAKHIEMFKATKTGAYVQSGKRWVCIDYTTIQVA